MRQGQNRCYMMTNSFDEFDELKFKLVKEISEANLKETFNWSDLKSDLIEILNSVNTFKCFGINACTFLFYQISYELVQCDSKGLLNNCINQLQFLIET